MKKILCSLSMLFILVFVANAQSQYEVTMDKNGDKVFKGFISREILQADTSFHWYGQNLKNYTPNTSAIANLKKYGDSIQIIAFMGTWCEDSHFVIPKFFMLADAANFSMNRVTILGVDRDKKTLGNLSEAMKITNVPTLVVMKNGHEIGRVVEYGKTGMWDKELGDIIATSN
jgi:thiol-disulfide isomerase/thioredoxin